MKIGILGNGQLGRMAAIDAARLGIEIVIYAPDSDGPANQVVRESHVGAYDDEAALEQFANSVDAITYEFENVPVSAARFVETIKPIYPQPIWLERAQHRLVEKDYARSKGLATAPYRPWKTELAGHVSDKDLIIKTCSGGYDGKGQWSVKAGEPFPSDLPAVDLIIEDKINLAGEISVIVCADQHGHVACFDPAWNVHKNGILDTSSVLSSSSFLRKQESRDIGLDPSFRWDDVCAEALKQSASFIKDEPFVGVMAIEFFITGDGKLLVNEFAPRPHNSGHWTIDACICSQFEQQIRAVAGLPLGSTQRHSDCVMTNLIGDDVDKVPALLNDPKTAVHLYGKASVRSGRKMGHVTRLTIKVN